MKQELKRFYKGLAICIFMLAFLVAGKKAEAAASGSCGTNVNWQFNSSEGKLTISGNGNMESAPWLNSYKKSIVTVEIKNGVKNVCDQAFWGCTNLKSVTFADSVIEIGGLAFYHCEALSTVVLPAKLEKLGGMSFTGCTSLKKITIPKTVTSASGGECFSNSGLEEVTFAYGMTKVPDYITKSAKKLKKVNFPNTITEIGSMVFYHCEALESIQLPAKLQKLGGMSFAGCKSLKKITIPKTVTSAGGGECFAHSALQEITYEYGMTEIPDLMMQNTDSLTKVNIPSTVTKIGMMAFYGCDGLTAITLPSSIKELEGTTFGNCSKLKTVTIQAENVKFGYNVFANSPISTIYGVYKSTASDYAAQKGYRFVVKWKPVKYLSISGIRTKAHTGKAVTQSIVVKDGNTRLTVNNQYTVTYKNNKNLGTATVTIRGKGNYYTGSISKTFRIVPAKNKVYHSGNVKYQVTNASTNGKGTVMVTGLVKKASSVKIPNSVKIGGISYKVTAISKKAFYKQTSLKKITVKASGIKSIGKNAFGKINKKATITVPKKQLKSYTKMITKSGVAKTVKIKK